MRLKNEWVLAFKKVFEKVPLEQGSKVYLFGSRVDDGKKGGDIDLLIVTTETGRDKLNKEKSRLLAELREAAQDQKVDITLATQQTMESDVFLKSLTNKVFLFES